MKEIADGVYYWTAHHPKIHFDVSSYFDASSATLIDPMEPADGLDWFAERPPQRIVLTNRHHDRDSERFVERFGCPVLCPETGLHEFEGSALAVEPYGAGPLADGVRALAVGAICPDDMALVLDRGAGLLSLADALINYDGIRFVREEYMDDPERVKRDTVARMREVVDEADFDGILFAHGPPMPTGGRAALVEFLASFG